MERKKYKLGCPSAELGADYFKYPEFSILSMGMSGDYQIAIEEGSTLVRIGSKVFE